MAGLRLIGFVGVLFHLTNSFVQCSLPDRFQESMVLTTETYKDCIKACDVNKNKCSFARYRNGRCTIVSASKAPKLVGFWPLNGEHLTKDISGNGNHGLAEDAHWTRGPDGTANGAYEFKGRSQSFLELGYNGALDVRYSMTLLMYVYVATTNPGPLFEWTYPGATDIYGVQLWQVRNLDLLVRYNKRGGILGDSLTCPLKVNAWHYVATSYDFSSGTAKIFCNGTTVESKNIGRHELETSRKVRVARRDKTDSRYFAGKISCLQLYDGDLNVNEINGAVKDNCKPPVASASSCSDNGYLVSGEKESIADAALRFSSFNRCSPKGSLARLDAAVAGYCDSFVVATNNRDQFLQFDLGTPRVVLKIVTQGRQDYSQWVTSYRLQYSIDGKQWSWYRQTDGNVQIFSANRDRNTKKIVTVPQPIYARFWRIRPYSWYRHITLRADLIGCYSGN